MRPYTNETRALARPLSPLEHYELLAEAHEEIKTEERGRRVFWLLLGCAAVAGALGLPTLDLALLAAALWLVFCAIVTLFVVGEV